MKKIYRVSYQGMFVMDTLGLDSAMDEIAKDSKKYKLIPEKYKIEIVFIRR
jgi:hypothetical protein